MGTDGGGEGGVGSKKENKDREDEEEKWKRYERKMEGLVERTVKGKEADGKTVSLCFSIFVIKGKEVRS